MGRLWFLGFLWFPLGLGAAHSPLFKFRECKLESATYSSKMCKNNESEVLDMVNEQRDSGNISVTNYLMGGDSKDPCFNNTKNLRINVTGNFCPSDYSRDGVCDPAWFLVDAWENTVINLRDITSVSHGRIDCVTRRKKPTPVGRRKA